MIRLEHDLARVDTSGPDEETRSLEGARDDGVAAPSDNDNEEETRALDTPATLDSHESQSHRSAPPLADRDDEESLVGEQLGRFIVLSMLGRGGMGTVYEAFDRILDRRVAVKVLHRDVATRHQQRLIREAQALAQLSHPNVVQVYEAGETKGRNFVAMELVQGHTLRQWLRQEPRPDWRACVEVYMQAGAGLAAAHEQGLVHCDFKPSNAIVDDKGRVRVLDFGLARTAFDGVDESRSDQILATQQL
ncbi:MAG: serine/threonine protein kinase, partial [Myxococcales bacterium]|nr:serine/threonine protein kinase [Myxococcales bacterium]